MNAKRDHREAVGGHWEEMGDLGLEFLMSKGLTPVHKLLDLGCGPGRIGRKLIDYLHPFNYVGIDREQWLLRAFYSEVAEITTKDTLPILLQMDLVEDDWDEVLSMKFDYAFAQSVFTHLSMDQIIKVLGKLKSVLSGSLYATYFEEGQGHPVSTYTHKDPFHYTQMAFKKIAAKTGYTVEFLGSWDHPRGQLMSKWTPH